MQVLCCKLFFVLGILWSIESVHFFLHKHYGAPCEDLNFIKVVFRVIDCCNILRGFFFFLIFVCKRDVLMKIRRLLKRQSRSSTITLELLERRSITESGKWTTTTARFDL